MNLKNGNSERSAAEFRKKVLKVTKSIFKYQRTFENYEIATWYHCEILWICYEVNIIVVSWKPFDIIMLVLIPMNQWTQPNFDAW